MWRVSKQTPNRQWLGPPSSSRLRFADSFEEGGSGPHVCGGFQSRHLLVGSGSGRPHHVCLFFADSFAEVDGSGRTSRLLFIIADSLLFVAGFNKKERRPILVIIYIGAIKNYACSDSKKKVRREKNRQKE